MWTYNKVLQYPVNIKCSNPRLANFIISFGFMPNSLMTNSIGFPASYIGKFDICGLKFIIILLDLDSYLAR